MDVEGGQNRAAECHQELPPAAIRQLVSKAITTEGEIIDVFTAAGLKKPDIGILSPQFFAEVRGPIFLLVRRDAARTIRAHACRTEFPPRPS